MFRWFKGSSIYHGDGPYSHDDSEAGIAEAADDGATAVDLNVGTCLTNKRFGVLRRRRRVMILRHWDRWWEHGYRPLPGTRVPRRPLSRLTLAQVQNLVDAAGNQIITAAEALEVCKAGGLRAFFELKPCRWTRWALEQVRIKAERLGVDYAVMTIHRYGATERARNRWERKAIRRMRLARKSGTGGRLLLQRGPVDWTRWDGPVNAVKGGRGGYRPKHVVRFGLSPADATRFGCGVNKRNARLGTAKVRRLIEEHHGGLADDPDHGEVGKLIALALGEVGYHEGRTGSTWNNHQKYSPAVPGLEWSQNQPWCDTFVCWLFEKTGLRDLLPVVSASCDTSATAWKKSGRWSTYPAIGAQVFYGVPGDMKHTGLVIDYDDTTITTVEGNTNTTGSSQGDGVYRLVRRRRDDWVQGYGYPAYAEGITSADPAWANRAA